MIYYGTIKMPLDANYLELLKERGKESHVYRDYQLAGLEVADMLSDRAHKALYIKLAKEYGTTALFSVARRIQDQKGIKNRGAYFMKVFYAENPRKKKVKKEKNGGDKTNRNNRRKKE